MLIVEKVNIQKESCSCNFCNRGKLNANQNGLIYPYEHVYKFNGDGKGLLGFICEACLVELNNKVDGIKYNETFGKQTI